MRIVKVTSCAAVFAGVLCNVPFTHNSGASDEAKDLFANTITNSLGMVFVSIPNTQVYFSIWETRNQDFTNYPGATRQACCGDNPGEHPTEPATGIRYRDAVGFCVWLTEKEQAAGRLSTNWCYRLPSDREWSAAVGLGQEWGRWPVQKSIKAERIYPWGTQWPPPVNAGNLPETLRVDPYRKKCPVGSFPPNKYGLYDMAGNVSEWCSDLFSSNQTNLFTTRGSDYLPHVNPEAGLRSGIRGHARDDTGGPSHVGFRCVLSPKEKAKGNGVESK